tara:strand:+ start:329 stop:688 length:360 start_codon:yes stop_codon:yes gene_type:complete
MDLQKMDPFARKLALHQEAFSEALSKGDADAALKHLDEVKKFADYLSEDIDAAITKADKKIGPNDIFAGGVPVRKFVENPHRRNISLDGDRLTGTITTGRHRNTFRPANNTPGNPNRVN